MKKRKPNTSHSGYQRGKKTCCQRKKGMWVERKSRGHLFVPCCVAKSLTEAILNDIGESLQSEQLRGGRRKEGEEESRERWGGITKRKDGEGSPRTLDAAPPCKQPVWSRFCASTMKKSIYSTNFGPGLQLPRRVTHRARYVRAGWPLAVGPGRGRAPDFLLFAQQLAVLLLPVLHVDEQRDEAVLHLVGFKGTTRKHLRYF